MTTPLTGPLKREVEVDGVPYTLTIDPERLTLVAKGRRKGHELTWSALVSGDAALATALTASLAAAPAVARKATAVARKAPAAPERHPSAPPARSPSAAARRKARG